MWNQTHSCRPISGFHPDGGAGDAMKINTATLDAKKGGHTQTSIHLWPPLGETEMDKIDSNGTQWIGCAVVRQTPNSVPEHHPITRKEHKQKPGHDQSIACCIRHHGIRRAGNWCQGTKDVITILATWSGITAITSLLLGASWSVPGAEDRTASTDNVIHYPHVVPATSGRWLGTTLQRPNVQPDYPPVIKLIKPEETTHTNKCA